jgi:hypothetical protein
MKRFYGIYNPKTEDLKPGYGKRTMPALYVTYGAAKGELNKQQKQRYYVNYEVREVELHVR